MLGGVPGPSGEGPHPGMPPGVGPAGSPKGAIGRGDGVLDLFCHSDGGGLLGSCAGGEGDAS